MTRLFLCVASAALGLASSAAAFVVSSCSPRLSVRPSSTTARAQEAAAAASPGSSDDTCPGYPRCSGEYREKGCDGTGRIAGGVGALLPWLPVKAYRPCPSFVEAKYKYSRQGQSLNEVVFARREGTMADIALEGGQKDLPVEPAVEANVEAEDLTDEETPEQGTGVGGA